MPDINTCGFECRQERRLSNLEENLKDIRKYSENKFDLMEDKSMNLNLRMESFTARTEQQIKEIDKSITVLANKIDKNMETQKANTWMFLTTLIFMLLSSGIGYFLK